MCILVYIVVYIIMCMIIAHYSTVAAILCQLPATSNPKTVGGMYYAKIGTIGLTSHHGTNYK